MILSPRSMEYLVQQKGELASLIHSDGQEFWVSAYVDQLEEMLVQVTKVVPFPRHVLDIGSGLGGIDMMLIRHTGCHCTLIDGEDSAPIMTRQDKPFCSRSAVDAFMADNNIAPTSYDYHNPFRLPVGPFDLVLSLGSWCFHYPPKVYLKWLLDNVEAGTTLILDVRTGRGWFETLNRHFHYSGRIAKHRKACREVFCVR